MDLITIHTLSPTHSTSPFAPRRALPPASFQFSPEPNARAVVPVISATVGTASLSPSIQDNTRSVVSISDF